MAEEKDKLLIIDFGSSVTKIGFSGELYPQFIIPTVIGYDKGFTHCFGEPKFYDYIGDEAISLFGVLKLYYPIDIGVIVDWEKLEKFLEIFFQRKLLLDPKNLRFLLTVPDNADSDYRNKLTTLFHVKFNVKNLKLVNQGFLALYRYNLDSGIVIDAGDTKINVIPYFKGNFVSQGFKQIELGGRTVVNRLQKLLFNRGYKFLSSAEKMIVKDMNEKLALISPINHDNLEEEKLERKYELPDGQIITIMSEIAKAPEIIFTPELAEIHVNSLQKTVFESLTACNTSQRTEIAKNIILVGGLTKLHGFKERLESELKKQFSEKQNFTIFSSEANDRIFFETASKYSINEQKNNLLDLIQN